MGSFTCIGCDSLIRGTDGLKSPPSYIVMLYFSPVEMWKKEMKILNFSNGVCL